MPKFQRFVLVFLAVAITAFVVGKMVLIQRDRAALLERPLAGENR